MTRLFSIGLIALLGLVLNPAGHANAPEEPAAPLHGVYVSGEILVQFKSNTPTFLIEGLHAAIGAVKKRNLDRRGGLQQVKLPNGMTVEEGIARYRKNSNVDYAEPNYLRHALLMPDDTSFGLLWGLNNTGQTVNGTTGTADADIDAPEAWDVTTGSSSVIIAVVDSGVDWNHPDLAANIWTNTGETPGNSTDDDGNGFVDDVHGWDFVDNDNDPTSEDTPGHGSHVSGTIAAVGDNSLGVTGIMWTAQIMPVRFLDASGSGSVADEVLAIQYAIDNGAKIINASYGDSTFSNSEFNAISAANTAGLLFVAAAGNDAQNNDSKSSYPANYNLPNIISVAASTQRDALASFSNFGVLSVDLAAPGTNIRSTVNMPSVGYAYLQGTSMATPHVTGVAGLVAAVDPSLTPSDIKRSILNSVDVKSSLIGKVLTGGRLNAFGAVQYPNGADLKVTENVSASAVIIGNNATFTMTVTDLGLLDAANVTLTDVLPGTVTFVSATPSQGSCIGTTTVTCDLGALAKDASATVAIDVTTTAVGAVNNTASVAGSVTDPVSANDSIAATVMVNNIPSGGGAGGGGGGGCGIGTPAAPSSPTGAAIFLLVLFLPLFFIRVWRKIRLSP